MIKFSIITPSYNQLAYLQRCVASVADQGEDVEHVVIDGGSSDGSVEWLRQAAAQGRLSFVSEPDSGMYDALNKGFDRASGTVFAWLNCDEQYLPGTLKFVRMWLENHSQTDLLSGSSLLIRPDGSLMAFRRASPLRRAFIEAAHLYNLSCGMFFRSSLWQRGIRFDPSFKNRGDQEWIQRMLLAGVSCGRTGRFLAAFCFTGQNLSRNPEALIEAQRLRGSGTRRAAPLLNGLRLIEKAMHAGYIHRPFDYAVYSGNGRRKTFHIKKASYQWPEKK